MMLYTLYLHYISDCDVVSYVCFLVSSYLSHMSFIIPPKPYINIKQVWIHLKRKYTIPINYIELAGCRVT